MAAEHGGVHPDPYLTAQLLSIVALLAATIEYEQILRRRRVARARDALAAEAQASGLVGLVRMFAADEVWSHAHRPEAQRHQGRSTLLRPPRNR